jgi:hypothetical protein
MAFSSLTQIESTSYCSGQHADNWESKDSAEVTLKQHRMIIPRYLKRQGIPTNSRAAQRKVRIATKQYNKEFLQQHKQSQLYLQ